MTLIQLLAVVGSVALVVTVVATGVVLRCAKRLAFVDRPGSEAHKQHAAVVPYGGGIAMLIGLAAALVTAAFIPTDTLGSAPTRNPLVVGVGALAMFTLGLRDDLRRLPARIKLLVQAGVCALVVWKAPFSIDTFRNYPVLAYGAAWLWLVLVSNVYNLLDHADGLAATVGAISVIVLLSGSLVADDAHAAALWISLIGVLLGFLFWNLPPARIYMGDAGSLPLGFLIGAGTLSVTFWPSGEEGSPLSVLSPLLITAIPLFDTAAVVIKRMRSSQPIMQGDRNHISHRLARLGMSPRASLATIAALQVALAGGALQLRTQELMPGIVVLAQSACIVLAVIFLETIRSRHE
jgi:UDP-GlcNAc:undecaprenyl-phosphate/decaprenyl-phosphate GlcNAc-1-phosphate transferase